MNARGQGGQEGSGSMQNTRIKKEEADCHVAVHWFLCKATESTEPLTNKEKKNGHGTTEKTLEFERACGVA